MRVDPPRSRSPYPAAIVPLNPSPAMGQAAQEDDADMSAPTLHLHAEVGKMAEDEMSFISDRTMVAHIKKSAQGLATKIQALQKTNQRIAKLEDDVSQLSAGRVPSGTRLFAVSFESPSWIA